MMKRSIIAIVAMMLSLAGKAQLPQFSPSSFADWIYTNPATELNVDNILDERILLYTTSMGLQQVLISPLFNCYPTDVIDMQITWITDQWQNDGFVTSKVALTAALLNDAGVAVDSVTYNPTSVSRTNRVNLSITVPRGMTRARLRFASWKADVNSCGAVKKIVMVSDLKADVNHDGEVNVNDVNVLIDVIQGGNVAEQILSRADVNQDGEITVNDINSVIDVILGH